MSQADQNNANSMIPVSMILFRFLVAGMIAAHGWARMLADAIVPFGDYLDAQGFPFGHLIAWGITVFEIVGTILIMAGSRYIPYLCGVFVAIYGAGIVLVHASAGWFVVGLGRNGMEYSVLLIANLALIAHTHWPLLHSHAGEADVKHTDN